MRQAIAQCVDRQALIDEFAFGQGRPPSSYLSADHPLYNDGAAAYGYDPAAASALLDELGWVPGADGVRVAAGFPGALNDTRLEMSLTTADDARSLAIAHSLQNSLDDCGIALLIDSRPGEQVFATGPDGPLFGRQFQLAQFAWPYGQQPSCYLYLSEAIPGEDFEAHRYGWGGWNLSGWSNPEFDAACQRAGSSLPEEQAYADAHLQAQALFAEQLPALPLFANMQLAAARPDFCNFALEPGSELLSNLEMLGFAEWCN
jgi:peptide/nickel transport system substrate-binding protein